MEVKVYNITTSLGNVADKGENKSNIYNITRHNINWINSLQDSSVYTFVHAYRHIKYLGLSAISVIPRLCIGT